MGRDRVKREYFLIASGKSLACIWHTLKKGKKLQLFCNNQPEVQSISKCENRYFKGAPSAVNGAG